MPYINYLIVIYILNNFAFAIQYQVAVSNKFNAKSNIFIPFNYCPHFLLLKYKYIYCVFVLS